MQSPEKGTYESNCERLRACSLYTVSSQAAAPRQTTLIRNFAGTNKMDTPQGRRMTLTRWVGLREREVLQDNEGCCSVVISCQLSVSINPAQTCP